MSSSSSQLCNRNSDSPNAVIRRMRNNANALRTQPPNADDNKCPYCQYAKEPLRRHCCGCCCNSHGRKHSRRCRGLIPSSFPGSSAGVSTADLNEWKHGQPNCWTQGPYSDPRQQRQGWQETKYLVSMGLKEAWGTWLIPQIGKENIIKALLQPVQDESIGGPLGNTRETQNQVSRSPGFMDVLEEVFRRVHSNPFVFVACNHGRHRSVAVVHIAKRFLEHIVSPAWQIHVIDLELGDCTSEEWENIWHEFGNKD